MITKKPKFYKKVLVLSVMSVVLLSLVMTLFPGTGKGQALEWSVQSNPSGGSDTAQAITADDNYIYIAGYDNLPGNNQWRIEKRRKSDGGVEWTSTFNPSSNLDRADSIIADTNYIYIAGMEFYLGHYRWRIEKRRKSDGGVEWVNTYIHPPADLYQWAHSITADNDYIYIAGTKLLAGITGEGLLVQKRRKSDGEIEWTQVTDPVHHDDRFSITEDSAFIYIFAGATGDRRIEKRRKSDGGVEWIQNLPFGMPFAHSGERTIVADSTYLYLTGYDYSLGNRRWHIEKRRKSDGGLEWTQTFNPSSGDDSATSIAIDAIYIYLVGYDNSPGNGNDQWRFEKRRKSDGGLVWEETFDFSPGNDYPHSMVIDGGYIYIAGSDNLLGNLQWRIEKRQKAPFQDIGLRVFNGTEIVAIAAEIGPATSPLRIAKNGVVYGIALIDQGSPEYGDPLYDSGVRIQTSSGIKALRRL